MLLELLPGRFVKAVVGEVFWTVHLIGGFSLCVVPACSVVHIFQKDSKIQNLWDITQP